jgi:probable F420-dependent oxidoreductase
LRPFRFGVSCWGAASAEEWRAKARRAEALGYDVFLVPDHLAAGVLSPFSALAIAAGATGRLRVGTYVLNNDLRHPVTVAREAATLHFLSGGRFELGLGAGHMQSEYEEAGIPFDRARTRVERLDESVRVIRALTGGEARFEGRHYRVRHELSPKLAGPMPLLVGGNGRRVLETAARHADIVSFTGFAPADGGRRSVASHFTAAGLEDRLGVVRAAAGERLGAIELNILVQAVIVTRDRAAAASRLAEEAPFGAEEVLQSPFLLIGTVEEIARQLRDMRQRSGISYATVFEGGMEALAPVVNQLAGR